MDAMGLFYLKTSANDFCLPTVCQRFPENPAGNRKTWNPPSEQAKSPMFTYIYPRNDVGKYTISPWILWERVVLKSSQRVNGGI